MNTDRAKQAWDQVAGLEGWDPSQSVEIGIHTSYNYRLNPKHLCFVLARYKFCSKLLATKGKVLEVGCGDAFGTPVVAQAVKELTAIDWDPRLVGWAQEHLAFVKNCTFTQHDIIGGRLPGVFDGIFSVDVIEHIDPKVEARFMDHCVSMLAPSGVFVVGTPNVRAEAYASASSRLGHINLKDASMLKELLARYFDTVLLFSMNDEVVHTGFYEMAHYLFGVGIGVKRNP